MQGDANVILRNAINVNQGLQMIDYADALHVENRACMLMHVARVSMSESTIKEVNAFIALLLSGFLGF